MTCPNTDRSTIPDAGVFAPEDPKAGRAASYVTARDSVLIRSAMDTTTEISRPIPDAIRAESEEYDTQLVRSADVPPGHEVKGNGCRALS